MEEESQEETEEGVKDLEEIGGEATPAPIAVPATAAVPLKPIVLKRASLGSLNSADTVLEDFETETNQEIVKDIEIGPPAGPCGPQGGPSVTPTTSASVSTQRNQLLKWESDEPLGDNATIAMILFSNKNHPNLKTDYPVWSDRIKQIAKIWKSLPIEKRQPYVQQARENRTASRMNKQVRTMIKHHILYVIVAKHVIDDVYYNIHMYVHVLDSVS